MLVKRLPQLKQNKFYIWHPFREAKMDVDGAPIRVHEIKISAYYQIQTLIGAKLPNFLLQEGMSKDY